MARTLDGMVCIITGASAGIGEALAKELSRHGARLTLAARRLDRLNALNQQLGGGHQVIQADVSRPTDCHQLVEQAHARFNRLDTLICNAGYGLISPIARTTEQQWLDIFRTNVMGTTACIEAAIPLMRQQPVQDGWRGQVMIVSSAAARRGLPFFGAYSATKAAQLSLAEALRVEMHRRRIAVTSVHPVGTGTDFFTTAEELSARHMPSRGIQVRQSPDHVARAMVRAIVRPRPEVWPSRSMHWALGLGMMLPGLVDRVLRGHAKSE
jgi:short-subunit dehydrogenase